MQTKGKMTRPCSSKHALAERLCLFFLLMISLVVLIPLPGLAQVQRCCQCTLGCFNPTGTTTTSCNNIGCSTAGVGSYVAGAFANESCPDGQGSYCPSYVPPETPTQTPTATPTNTPVPQGGECSDTAQCSIGFFCADGVCCDAICDLPFQSCNLPGSEGTCTIENAPAPAASNEGLLMILGVLSAVGLFALRRLRAD